MTLRDLFILIGFKIDKDTEKKVEDSIRGIKDTATALLGAIGIGFSIAQVNELSEEFRTVNDKIEQATRSLEDQQAVQEKILEAANDTKAAYADTAKVVMDLMQENTELFGTLDEAIAFNNACTMLFKTAGKTNDQIAGLMESINKSFAKGKVDSETISQLLEQSPEAVALLNRRLGTTTDQLEDLASEGKISLKDLRDSFLDASDEIAAAFEKTSFKISDATLYIRNKFGLWVAQVDEALGVSQGLGNALVTGFNKIMGVIQKVSNRIVWLADKMGGLQNVMKLILIVAGSIFGVLNFSKIVSGIKGVVSFLQAAGKWLTTINLKTVGIIAVVALLALLVEDFIKFIKGEDSLIGEILEAAGIDVEAFRKLIITFWNNIKGYLGAAVKVIKALLSGVGEFVITFIGGVFDVIIGLLKMFNAIFAGDWAAAGDAILEILYAIVETIFGLIMSFFKTIILAAVEFLGGVVDVIADVATTIYDVLNGVWDWISGIAEDAFTWGSDIIQAICDGIMAGIGWVADAASSIASEIKKFLGFSEPEEGPLSNFHTYMPDMIDLMTTGIRAGRTKVREAISELSGDVSANASMKVFGSIQRAATVAPQTLRATQAATTSKVVNQTNNFTNTFSGDRDIQRKASTAMDKASGSATGQLARALAFVN